MVQVDREGRVYASQKRATGSATCLNTGFREHIRGMVREVPTAIRGRHLTVATPTPATAPNVFKRETAGMDVFNDAQAANSAGKPPTGSWKRSRHGADAPDIYVLQRHAYRRQPTHIGSRCARRLGL